MRVVFYGFVTHFGGAQRSMVELAARLSAHVEVSVVDPYGCCSLYADAARAAGLDYHVLFPRTAPKIVGGHGRFSRAIRAMCSGPELIKIRRRSRRLLAGLGAAAVICNNVKSAAMVSALWTARRPFAVLVHMRGWYTPDMIPFYARWLYQKRCTALMAVSRATRSALMCSGIDMGKIYVLPNPIDLDDIIARADRPPEAPTGSVDAPIRILLPAGLLRTKGQHTAVRAMRQILDDGHDAVLWLAGDVGYGNDESYVPKTQELARSLGVDDRVVWLGLRHDIPQLMQAATMVVLPTHSEGMPRAILEAMALAKPVAATPAGGITDLILPGVTGLLFDVEDHEGLARCVDRFARDGQEAAMIGQQAQQYMRREFTPAGQVEQALRIIRKVTQE